MIARRLRASLALAAFASLLSFSTALASSPAETILPVPYRSQADGSIWAATNCGPTSIAMVLEAFGIKVSNTKLRERANQLLGISSPSTGTRIQDLARIVQEYGLSVNGPYNGSRFKQWSLDEVRSELQAGRPLVVQVYFPFLPNHRKNPISTDHFIVLTGVSGDSFVFNDPADRDSPGYHQTMTADELSRAWKASQFPMAGFSVGPGTVGQPLISTTQGFSDVNASSPENDGSQQQPAEPAPSSQPQQENGLSSSVQDAVPILSVDTLDLLKQLMDSLANRS